MLSKPFGYYILHKVDQLTLAELTDHDKIEQLYKLLVFMMDEITKRERIHLTSLFTKIAYISNKYKLSKTLIYNLHAYRRSIQDIKDDAESMPASFDYYKDTITLTIHRLFMIPIDQAVRKLYYDTYGWRKNQEDYSFISSLEVLVLAINKEENTMQAISSLPPYEESTVLWDVVEENEIYSDAIHMLLNMEIVPIAMYFHSIKINQSDQMIPSIIVIEPSYLIDVTMVSNCFQHYGSESRDAIIKRFMTVYANASIMKGNVANFFLDEVIHDTSISFEDIKKQIFNVNPLAFSLMDDRIIIELLRELEHHFNRIKHTIQVEFTQNNLTKEHIYIEPAFYSPQYGIQGRLDLLHYQEKEKKASIIELKSGKPYRANKYGLNSSHYHQTLLYDLLVHSSLGKQLRVNNYILYSGVADSNMRYAPKLGYQQKEAIKVRNEIVMNQYMLEGLDEGKKDVFSDLKTKNFPKLKGFAKADIEHFEKLYDSLDEQERSYFKHFTAFIAREQRLSKIGSKDSERLNGLAAIWLNTADEKIDAFTILNHLELVKNESEDEIPVLRFIKSGRTAELSNFRVGDISVLYPDNKGMQQAALHSQVLKGTILELNENDVLIRLRSRQHNHDIFRDNKYWHIEHDRLDSGFNAMYRSLFEFMKSTQRTKDIWLSRIPPESFEKLDLPLIEEFTEEQQEIFDEIISAKDYYLLWGPPGTGKTSFIVRHVVKHLYQNTEENILLLAYTNKAVDEICDAICDINPNYKEKFLRIGSRYGTHPDYVHNLLIHVSETSDSRRQLVDHIQSKRIFTGTIASIMGKPELFSLKKFDRIIIDEASQLLEPLILGVLSRFNKVILIGDHIQLPAVVQQDKEQSEVSDTALRDLGLRNMANSLFQRLYERCEANGWDWSIGQLSVQGRMHEDIMAFPNEEFYGGQLSYLKKLPRLYEDYDLKYEDASHQAIATERLIYVPSTISDEDLSFKTNADEARIVLALVESLQILMELNDIEYTIGVITPYRAQIANIRSTLLQAEINIDQISIDTVERYQGGARDIIIMSFSLNHAIQLDSLSMLDESGNDRKLNVALTRAKEQLIITGNESLMEQNKLYKKLIHSYCRLDLKRNTNA